MVTCHRRSISTAVFVLAVALTVPFTAACNGKTAADCAKLAWAVHKDIDELQRTVVGVAINRKHAHDILDQLHKDLDKVEDKMDDSGVDDAAHDLDKAARKVGHEVDNGEHVDMSPVKDAGKDLKNVCTS